MFGQDITITITMTKDGQINVNGPLENKFAMFGLLEIAKETVTKFNDAATKATVEQRIALPPSGFKLV